MIKDFEQSYYIYEITNNNEVNLLGRQISFLEFV